MQLYDNPKRMTFCNLCFSQDDIAKLYGHVNEQGSAKLQVGHLVSVRKVFKISKYQICN